MWIIPKTLSQYVPATPGLNLVSSEQAWMLEQSVTWRSKFMSKQYWSKRWKKGDYVQHLCGLMPKPSLHQSFVEKYTASLPDIPVSRSVARGSEKEKKTQGTYGHISESTSGQLDLFGAFSKMSKDTPRWGYGESCPIWKKRVIDARGAYSQRKKLALHTNGNECSSWGTPKEQDSRAASWDRGKSNLGEQVHGLAKKNWATPQASDHVEGARTAKESNQKCLGRDLNQMKHAGPPAQEKSSTSGKNQGSWPTARSSDAEGGRIKTERTEKGFRSKREKSDQYFGAKLRDAAEMEKPPTMKLNPNWVEQLMGLPIGWTDLGSWGMELSHKQQN